MSTALAPQERDRLAQLEEVVERGLETFIEVGSALMEIRDSRLYRQMHKTFADYLDARWGMSRSRGYQLVEAATVSTMVDAAGLPVPANERQARALAPLLRDEGEEAMIAVYRDARERHGDAVTAAMIEDARQRLRAANRNEVFFGSESNEWYTPPEVLDAAREVLGAIDLDPASCAKAQEWVRAENENYYSKTERGEDGLKLPWAGRVWLNPPYGGEAGKWVRHLLKEYEAVRVTAAIMLLNGHRIGASWFEPLHDYPLCWLNRRITFYSPSREVWGRPSVTPVLVYVGHDFDAFTETFSALGTIHKDPTGREWSKRYSSIERVPSPHIGT